jgi:glutaredoxin
LELRDDTPKLFLTWVDAKGDFHVAQKVADVPAERRDQVRVVRTDREEGTGAWVYVADLRTRRADGTYPVITRTRAQWDEVGASLRKARLEALAPAAQPAAGSASVGGVAASGPVVIYGSETCGACRMAARWLTERKVAFVEKRVDESDAARAELETKLRRANLPDRGQIPVIDVHGRLLIGFDPRSLERALSAGDSRAL